MLVAPQSQKMLTSVRGYQTEKTTWKQPTTKQTCSFLMSRCFWVVTCLPGQPEFTPKCGWTHVGAGSNNALQMCPKHIFPWNLDDTKKSKKAQLLADSCELCSILFVQNFGVLFELWLSEQICPNDVGIPVLLCLQELWWQGTCATQPSGKMTMKNPRSWSEQCTRYVAQRLSMWGGVLSYHMQRKQVWPQWHNGQDHPAVEVWYSGAHTIRIYLAGHFSNCAERYIIALC